MDGSLQISIINFHKHALEEGTYSEVRDIFGKIISENEPNEKSGKVNESNLLEYMTRLKKDYSWLIKKYFDFDEVSEILGKGGVPALPLNSIWRRDLEMKVKTELTEMKENRCRYLVLHGLVGLGKKVLAVRALYDLELISTLFDKNIIWLTVGYDGENQISILQQDLNARLRYKEQQLSSTPRIALSQLRLKYKSYMEKCLIVLDGVHSEKVIEFLDVETNFLIITENIDIMKKKKSITRYVEVTELNKEETLNLFTSSLHDNLPKTAIRQILDFHKIFKGHTLTLSLIATQLQEHKKSFLQNMKQWLNHYKKNHNNRNTSSNFKGEEYEYVNDSIRFALNELSKDDREYFQHFVLFSKDVNIAPEICDCEMLPNQVLEMIWSLSRVEVEIKMKYFYKRSLVQKKWNENLKTDVYGVHDLILDYFNSELDSNLIKSLHKKLMSKYTEICQGDFSCLPNDNYIFHYFGHHLKAAELYSQFPKVYTNLEFLEAKLKNVEPNDLLLDFKRYREYIVNDTNLNEINELVSFIEFYGCLIRKGLDICQLALQENKDTFIYKRGLELAEKKSKKGKLFMNFPLGDIERRDLFPQIINTKESISYLKFTNHNCVIVASDKGLLQLYNAKGALLSNYIGHTNAITRIILSKGRNLFYTSSLDSTIRAWKLDIQEKEQTPSPGSRQTSHLPLWSNAQTNKEEEEEELHICSGPIFWFSVHETFIQTQFESKIISTKFAAGINDNSKFTLSMWKNKETKFNLEVDMLNSLEFTPCGNYIVIGGATTYIICLKGEVNKILSNNRANFVGFIGLNLVTASNSRIEFWEPSEGAYVSRNTDPVRDHSHYSLFSAGKHFAFTNDRKDLIVLHGITMNRHEHFCDTEKVLAMEAAKDKIALGYHDGTVEIKPLDFYDGASSKVIWPKNEEQPIIARVKNGIDLQVVRGKELFPFISYSLPTNKTVEIRELEMCLRTNGKFDRVVFATSEFEIYTISENSVKEYLKDLKFSDNFRIFKTAHYKENLFLIVSTDKDNLTLYNLDSDTPFKVRVFGNETKGLSRAFIRPDGSLLVEKNGAIQVINIEEDDIKTIDNGSIVTECPSTGNALYTNPISNLFVLTAEDVVYPLKNNLKTSTHQLGQFSPDGKKLYVVYKSMLLIKEMSTGVETMFSLPDLDFHYRFTKMAVSTNGTVVICSNQPISILISSDGKCAIAAVQIKQVVAFPELESFAALDRFDTLHILNRSN